MTPIIDNYLKGRAIDEAPRAATAWTRILEKPTSVTIKRETGATIAAQTVRIEASNTVREIAATTGKSSSRDVIVFGIKGHPTLPDTDIRQGDRFAVAGTQYRVVDLVLTLGSKQARCEQTS